MPKQEYDAAFLASCFEIEGAFLAAKPWGSGHINDTYALDFDQAGTRKRYVLQRINHHVFRNPLAVMENIARVTRHIRAKLEAAGAGADADRRVLTLIPARDGTDYCQDAEGNTWRVYRLIERAHTVDVPESADQIREAARAFGEFQRLLADLPPPPLHETIPDFHNSPKRLKTFRRILEEDRCNRARGAEQEIEFVLKHAAVFDILPALVGSGEIPVRTTHNDAKVNNVMLDDETGEGICVIDLDTVMPGLSAFDFGDLCRTCLSASAEDERDLSKVRMEMARFEAIARGYLSSAGAFLNEAERAHLVTGAKTLTLEQGMRFLADYLDGDRYYKTHREGHNLDRSRTQFKLLESILEKEEEMTAVVERG